jgi:hypothetical protein
MKTREELLDELETMRRLLWRALLFIDDPDVRQKIESFLDREPIVEKKYTQVGR